MIYEPNCFLEWFWGTFSLMFDEEKERERALAKLCVSKCSKMDLTNHKTAYFAIRNLPQPHKDNLKRMGYGMLGKLPPKIHFTRRKKTIFPLKKNIYFLIFSGIFFQNTARFLNRTLQSRQRCSRRSACNARRMGSKAPILKLLCALGKACRNLQRYPCFPVDGVYLRASFSVKVSSKSEQKPLPARELRTTGSGTFHPDPPRWQAAPPRRYEQHRWRALQYPFVWC